MAVKWILARSLQAVALVAVIGCGGCQVAAPQTYPAPTGFTHAASTAVKAAGNRLAQALEIPPRITPAVNPAGLDSLPPHLDPSVYVQFAHTAEQQGHLAAAQRYFDKAVEAGPEDLSALIAYARFCDRHRLTETAVAVYQQAREAVPSAALVPNDLGLLYARHGRLPQAVEHLQQAVALQPENVRYRNNLAQILIAMEQPEAAVATLAAVLPPAGAHYNAACMLHEQGRVRDSYLHLTRALELDPYYGPARDMLARSQAQTSVASVAGPPTL